MQKAKQLEMPAFVVIKPSQNLAVLMFFVERKCQKAVVKNLQASTIVSSHPL